MKSFWKQIIVQTVLQKNRKATSAKESYSDYEIAKGFRQLKRIIVRQIKDIFLIILGITAATIGLESFLLPNTFIDGGATGISLLLTKVTAIPLSVFLLVINLPFVFLGYKVITREFAIKTSIAIIGLAISVATIHFSEVTHDKLLVAVFGGFFLGAGIGLSVRGGAVLDGTEVMAIFLSRKLKTTIGDIIIVFNIIIFSVAAYVLSIDAALYSLITYLTASKTLDFVVEGIEEYTGVTIISTRSEAVKEMIINKLGRGVTVYTGKGGHGKRGTTHEIDIVYTVITRLELSKLNNEIEKIDHNAFIVTSSVKDTKGGMIKKRPLKD